MSDLRPDASAEVDAVAATVEAAVEAARALAKTRRQARLASAVTERPSKAALKSDMKKASIMARKVKTFAQEHLKGLTEDLERLNVNMFVSEIAQNVAAAFGPEGRLRTAADVRALAMFCHAVHVRYEPFLPELHTHLKKLLALDAVTQPMKAKLDLAGNAAAAVEAGHREGGPFLGEDAVRARNVARFAAELWLLGLVPSSRLVNRGVLKPLVAALDAAGGHHTHGSLAIMNAVVRTAGPELLNGACPGHGASASETAEARAQCEARVEAATQFPAAEPADADETRALLHAAAGKASALCGKLGRTVEGQWRHLCETQEIRGQLPPETLAKFEGVAGEVRHLITATELLCCGAGVPDLAVAQPDLSRATASTGAESVVITSRLAEFYNVKECEQRTTVFDDDEQRQFYEDLPEVAAVLPQDQRVPGHALSLVEAAKEREKEREKEKDQAREEKEDKEAPADRSGPIGPVPGEEKTPPELSYDAVEALLARLPQCAAVRYIDEWLSEFLCAASAYYVDGPLRPQEDDALEAPPPRDPATLPPVPAARAFFNNCRRRLAAALRIARTGAVEMVPMYCRAVATLSRVFPDHAEVLATRLEGEMHYMLREKTQAALGRKLRACRFIAELVKFRSAPPVRALSVLQHLVGELSGAYNAEALASMLEWVGPFLARGGVTKQRLDEVLEALRKKRNMADLAAHLEERLDGSLTIIRLALQPQARRTADRGPPPTTLELFARRRWLVDLTAATAPQLHAEALRFPWTERHESTLLCRVLRDIDRCAWGKVHLIAALLAAVSDVHGWVGCVVVDMLLEDARLDLEHPGRRPQQRRLQDLKYLGELYNRRIVPASALFYVFGQQLLFFPRPSPPTDYSRVRAVCVLLETAAPYLLTKPTDFLVDGIRRVYAHLALLVHTRLKPLPHELDFKLTDALAVVTKALAEAAAKAPAARAKRMELPPFPSTRGDADALVAELGVPAEAGRREAKSERAGLDASLRALIKASPVAPPSVTQRHISALRTANSGHETASSGVVFPVLTATTRGQAPDLGDAAVTFADGDGTLARPLEQAAPAPEDSTSSESSSDDSSDDEDDEDDAEGGGESGDASSAASSSGDEGSGGEESADEASYYSSSSDDGFRRGGKFLGAGAAIVRQHRQQRERQQRGGPEDRQREDAEVDALMQATLKESSTEAQQRVAPGSAFARTVERTMEKRLGVDVVKASDAVTRLDEPSAGGKPRFAPMARAAPKAPKAAEAAPAEEKAGEEKVGEPARPRPRSLAGPGAKRFALLRRAGDGKDAGAVAIGQGVEAKALYIPGATDFVQGHAQAHEDHRSRITTVRAQTVRINHEAALNPNAPIDNPAAVKKDKTVPPRLRNWLSKWPGSDLLE